MFINFRTFKKRYTSFVITSINTYVTITAHTLEALWGTNASLSIYKTEKSNNFQGIIVKDKVKHQ
ncbi:hypothetical protein BC059799_3016 [Bacillus cereus NVH0597-99]|nr:hypothetical protein BC059799_3016 [Bacillus cereus NVH0597-99]